MNKLTPRQAAVALALKHDLAQYKEVSATAVFDAIEADRSGQIWKRTHVTVGDISPSAVLDALRKFGLPSRKLPGRSGNVFVNPFHAA